MRSDASALLQKLNRQTFNYRQFPDPYSDLELWPIFEALLRDPRVVESKLSRVDERQAEFQQARALRRSQNTETQVPEGHPLEEHFSALFSAYATEPNVRDTKSGPEPKKSGQMDLRIFFSRLQSEGK